MPGSPSKASPAPSTHLSGDQKGKAISNAVAEDDEGVISIGWPLQPSPGRQLLSLSRRDLNKLRRHDWVTDQFIQFGIHYVLRDPAPFGQLVSPERPPREDIHILDALFYRQLKDGIRQSKRKNMFSVPYLVIPLHLGVHRAVTIVVNAHLILSPTPSEAADGRRGKVPIEIHPAQPPPTKKTRHATAPIQPCVQIRPYPHEGMDPRAMPLLSIQDFMPLPTKPSAAVRRTRQPRLS
ncbi:unnamed protein product [Tilletia controversa]|uniref:Uncharacterized protein n=1 Tax=Tilletia controversa TaxID=13291 RepID=A0A8X7SWJ4_9BASI|nr:hypothetical protein CF328_g4315 [Tilletia controversa]KAE8246198.1 hypothetical protein A4X06_0g5119 [Tilletia controversa]CAD6917695.1 unnamed protein product [Tilletia controversa]CAD6917813.1 unnamed protein product [Tilletia controversa]CAD6922682.1 unnamed protein product [Tilletia controversa]